MLTLSHVYKTIGTTSVLQDITFSMTSPRIVGLAGASGSGKSTLLRLIQGLDVPDEGTIACTQRLGFMFQDFQLFPHMTVWQNIMYAPQLHMRLKDADPEAQQACCRRGEALAHTLGLAEKLQDYPRNLSGGQKQRTALARSLMTQPEILLCDEPTSGLDMSTMEDVAALLQTAHSMGVGIIAASHDLGFLWRIAHEIIVLKEGRMAHHFRTQDIDNPSAYMRALYEGT